MTKYLWIVLSVCSLLIAQESPHGPLRWKCTDCHTTEGWNELSSTMKFGHSQTQFSLRGQHRNAQCRQCHTTLRFAGTSQVCVTCHQNDFDRAASPDHRKAGFNTDCLLCHASDAMSWRSSFDHNKTQFPTRGIHEAVECSSCHSNGLFRKTPKDCSACHMKDYTATTSPNHTTARFPLDCATCHRALTWKPAAFFPHEQYFPIGSADKHRPGRWNDCTDCHTAAPNYALFECINCHEHSKASMDSEHKGKSGYVYQSTACYRCHPRGDGD